MRPQACEAPNGSQIQRQSRCWEPGLAGGGRCLMGAEGQFGKLSSGLGGQSLSRRDWSGRLPDLWRLPLVQGQQWDGSRGLVVLAAPSPADVQKGPRPGRGPCVCKCPPRNLCVETGFKELAPATGKSAGRAPRDELVLQLEPGASGGRHPCSRDLSLCS